MLVLQSLECVGTGLVDHVDVDDDQVADRAARPGSDAHAGVGVLFVPSAYGRLVVRRPVLPPLDVRNLRAGPHGCDAAPQAGVKQRGGERCRTEVEVVYCGDGAHDVTPVALLLGGLVVGAPGVLSLGGLAVGALGGPLLWRLVVGALGGLSLGGLAASADGGLVLGRLAVGAPGGLSLGGLVVGAVGGLLLWRLVVGAAVVPGAQPLGVDFPATRTGVVDGAGRTEGRHHAFLRARADLNARSAKYNFRAAAARRRRSASGRALSGSTWSRNRFSKASRAGAVSFLESCREAVARPPSRARSDLCSGVRRDDIGVDDSGDADTGRWTSYCYRPSRPGQRRIMDR